MGEYDGRGNLFGGGTRRNHTGIGTLGSQVKALKLEPAADRPTELQISHHPQALSPALCRKHTTNIPQLRCTCPKLRKTAVLVVP